MTDGGTERRVFTCGLNATAAGIDAAWLFDGNARDTAISLEWLEQDRGGIH